MLLVSIDALIKKIKPDIVQTWLPQMDIVGGIAALWNSVPWIVSERTSEFSYQSFKLSTWARYSLARYAGAIVANSSGGVAYWRRKRSTDSLTFQIENAVDVAAIRDVASASGAYSNLNDNVKEILVVGRLTPTKALEIVIQAVRLVPDRHAIHVSIIGQGPLREEIKTSICKAGLDNRITLLPYRPDWWGLLKSASVLVSVSRVEGQPNVVLETMAAGCPLIVSDIPAHREFLDENSAILVPFDNPVALAEAIISLLTDPVSARQRAERASTYVAGLTIQLAADAYESVYKKVKGGAGK
jgi:glycosyltransferase involved in cell wall biosynthesis